MTYPRRTELAIEIIHAAESELMRKIDFYKNAYGVDWSDVRFPHALAAMLETAVFHRASRNRVIATFSEFQGQKPLNIWLEPMCTNRDRNNWTYLLGEILEAGSQVDPNLWRRAEINTIGKYTVELKWS